MKGSLPDYKLDIEHRPINCQSLSEAEEALHMNQFKMRLCVRSNLIQTNYMLHQILLKVISMKTSDTNRINFTEYILTQFLAPVYFTIDRETSVNVASKFDS